MGKRPSDEAREKISEAALALGTALSAVGPKDDGEQAELAALGKQLDLLVNMLLWAEILSPHHQHALQSLRPSAVNRRVRLSVVQDKRAVVSPDIDCAALAPLCKLRCCRIFDIELSREDIADGIRWELGAPYLLERNHQGCSYLGPSGCTTYETRPATCRSFDCRQDKRVWLDWDKKIPAPLYLELEESDGDGDGNGGNDDDGSDDDGSGSDDAGSASSG